jgi:hypothetical protein
METHPRLTSKNNSAYMMPNVPPGSLQYYVKEETICNFDIERDIKTNIHYKKDIKDREGYELEQHTKDNLLRLTPLTSFGKQNKDNLKILLIIKRQEGDKICIKGALRNTKTNEILLITSINKEENNDYTYRTIKSHDMEYNICQCKMIAPLLFWDELKNRLLY